MNPVPKAISVSVIVLNYEGAKWIRRCAESLREQTVLEEMEIIIADNASRDGSNELARDLIAGWPNAVFIQHATNLGFCEGNNVSAKAARGEYLFFLNHDAWLERDCIEKLLAGTRRAGASAATPLVRNYDDDSEQRVLGMGYDIFGLPCLIGTADQTRELFMPPGCTYLIEAALFRKLGGFDREIFLYSDELDLSWKVWISGGRCVVVPAARAHHRWAVSVNPKGDSKVVENRTSDSKRFYANRNALLILLKNAQHLLLGLVILQLAMLLAEAIVALIVVRRWSFIRRAYLDAVADCWRLRGHILEQRRRVSEFRSRSDWWMLRFLTWRLNRWEEVVRVWRTGFPKVTKG